MSGGSFNYLYFKLSDNPFDFENLETLEIMANWLRDEGKNESANELMRVHSELQQIKEKAQKISGGFFADLLKEAEWWCSGDTGEDDFDNEWAKYAAQPPLAGDGETARA